MTLTIDDLLAQLARIPDLERQNEQLRQQLKHQAAVNHAFAEASAQWTLVVIMGRVTHVFGESGFTIEDEQALYHMAPGDPTLDIGDVVMVVGRITQWPPDGRYEPVDVTVRPYHWERVARARHPAVDPGDGR